jgi:hypothetical protein
MTTAMIRTQGYSSGMMIAIVSDEGKRADLCTGRRGEEGERVREE